MTILASAGRLCKRFGPGRLPGAENRNIGAGYAFATAALSAATVFILVTGYRPILQYGLEAFGPGHEGIYLFGAYALPFVVPSAFVAGGLAWEFRLKGIPFEGAFAGIVATILTYAIATPLAISVYYWLSLVSPAVTMSRTPLDLIFFFAFFGFLFTFWLTLPLGAISGHIHERAVTDATTDGDSTTDAATDGLGTNGGYTDEHGLQAREQVERLLLRNGGRMTGADIVEATGWSEAEVAEAVSILVAADRVERRHEVGDTVICYPEE